MLRVLLALFALAMIPSAGLAQDQRAEWNRPVPPFRIAGNVYYVGTAGIASYLITDPAGHVLIDGAMEESADRIAGNIRALGFRIEDVKYLLVSHAHWDHVGGLAALQRLSGARLVVAAGDGDAMATGITAYRDDVGTFPPVRIDRLIGEGETVTIGTTILTARMTPGHTRGGTSWTMTTREGDRNLDILFACSLTVAGQRLVGDARYPEAARDFEASFDRLDALRADVFLGSHTGMFDFEAKRARLVAGNVLAFVDPAELPAQVARARTAFAEELARQSAAATSAAEVPSSQD